MLTPKETAGSKKGRTMLVFAIILTLLVVAGPVGKLEDASAGGSVEPSNPEVNLYFSGNRIPYKLGPYNYGLLTIKYDGQEIVKDKRITSNGGFGGVTSGRVHTRASVFVQIKLYDHKDTKLGEQQWENNLHDGDKPSYWYKPTSSCAFDMQLLRSGNNVTVDLL